MNLIEISTKYNTREKCIDFLEKKRWGNKPISPFTGKPNVTKRKNSIYWHCNDTNKDFTVLKGTIFEASKLPLPKWFMLISIMLHAKKDYFDVYFNFKESFKAVMQKGLENQYFTDVNTVNELYFKENFILY